MQYGSEFDPIAPNCDIGRRNYCDIKCTTKVYVLSFEMLVSANNFDTNDCAIKDYDLGVNFTVDDR